MRIAGNLGTNAETIQYSKTQKERTEVQKRCLNGSRSPKGTRIQERILNEARSANGTRTQDRSPNGVSEAGAEPERSFGLH